MKFELSSEQVAAASKWWKDHPCSKKYAGASGGALIYTFCPTGLGVVQKAVCGFPNCGEELDLTKYEEW